MTLLRSAVYGGVLAGLLGLGACGTKPMMSGSSAAMPMMMSGSSTMTSRLSGASEVPPVSGTASGTLDASLDKQTNVLSWTVTYSGLSGAATGAHFHGPAMPGDNAGVVVPLSGSLASPIKGTATLTAAQVADLKAGKWYINVHTAANPGGEIRGQVNVQP